MTGQGGMLDLVGILMKGKRLYVDLPYLHGKALTVSLATVSGTFYWGRREVSDHL